MKRFYYRTMAEINEHIGWNLFIFDLYGTTHSKFLVAADRYKRKLAMLKHPSNG